MADWASYIDVPRALLQPIEKRLSGVDDDPPLQPDWEGNDFRLMDDQGELLEVGGFCGGGIETIQLQSRGFRIEKLAEYEDWLCWWEMAG